MRLYLYGNSRERHIMESFLRKGVKVEGIIENTGNEQGEVFGYPSYRILDYYKVLSDDDVILAREYFPTNSMWFNPEISACLNKHVIPIFGRDLINHLFIFARVVNIYYWLRAFFVSCILFRINKNAYIKRIALDEARFCRKHGLKMVLIGNGQIADYLIKTGMVYGWITNSEILTEYPVKTFLNYEELLLEDVENYYFYYIDTNISVKAEGLLLELGFLKSQIYGTLDLIGTQYNSAKIQDLLDPLLGYNFRGIPYDGMVLFKNDEEISKDKAMRIPRIVTLGGSTTDATENNIKSWSEYLFESMRNMGYKYDVYCAGAAAYSVSQELLKLIRDILPLEPDVVISFSGVNDCYLDYLYEMTSPFVMKYQLSQISSFVEKCGCTNIFQNAPIVGVTSGISWNGTNYEHWIRTEKMMHAICEENGVKFYAFLQPHNKNIKYYINSDELDKKDKFYKECKAYIKEKKEDWIIDLSELFDDTPSVFCDICHVYEVGNRKIAREILSCISTSLVKGE